MTAQSLKAQDDWNEELQMIRMLSVTIKKEYADNFIELRLIAYQLMNAMSILNHH